MFITFEGIEGSGKSTLINGVAEHLRAAGYDVTATREPGGTPAGDAVRTIFLQQDLQLNPLTEAMLVNASRAALVADVIRPALSKKNIVLCDRFTDSTLAYQGYGRGLDLTMLRSLCDAATGGLQPDLTFVLDIPVELSEARRSLRGNGSDRLEDEARPFHTRVHDGFLTLAKGKPRMHVLDGTHSPEVLLENAMVIVKASLP
jgi:dTMP kinase